MNAAAEPPETCPERAGFKLPLDMLIAPARGLATVARTSEWWPAFAVIAVCTLGALALERAALQHVARLHPDTITPPAELAIVALLVPLLTAGMVAAVFTLFGGSAEPRRIFGRFFALVINCLVPSAAGDVIHAVAVAVHPAASYAGVRDIVRALPDNLGMLAAPGNQPELYFLQSFNIFDVWSFVVLAFGIALFAGMRFGWAVTISAIFYFVFAYI